MAAKKPRKIILIDHEDLQPKRAKPGAASANQPPGSSVDRTTKAVEDQENPSRSSQEPLGQAAPRRELAAGASSAQVLQGFGGVKPTGGQAGPQWPLARTSGAPQRPPSGSLQRPGWSQSQDSRRVAQGASQAHGNAGQDNSFLKADASQGLNGTEGASHAQLHGSSTQLQSLRMGPTGPAYPARPEVVSRPQVWQHPGKRPSAAPKASPMVEKLQIEATCQKLWDPPEEGELKPVPGDFPSVDAYVAAFEPFVFAECRAELRQEWQEVCDGSKNHYEVIVTGLEMYESGGHDVRLTLRNPTIRLGMKKDAGSLQFREGAVGVLTPAKPDLIDRRRGMQRGDQEREEQESQQVRVAGVVIMYAQGELRGDADRLVMRVYQDKGQAGKGGAGPSAGLDVLLKESPSWWFTPLSNLVTNQREYEGLHSIRHFQSLMRAAILKPKQELFPKYTQQDAPSLTGWLTPAFAEHLQRSFNAPQLASIKWSAAHVASGARGKNAPMALGSEEAWPFTLIQGPPGTGKTHTVWGILNVVHLVQYQRYFTSLLQKLAPAAVSAEDDLPEKSRSRPSAPSSSDGSLDSILSNMDASLKRVLPQLSPKPRLLVCAPSNAATDELLARVLDRGFIDGELRSYKPNVARVGLDFGSPAAQAVSVERRANQLLSKPAEEVHKWIPQLQQNEQALRYRMAILQKELAARAAAMRGGAVGMEPEQLASLDKERDAKLQELAALREQHDKLLVDLERFLIVAEKYRPGSRYNRTEGHLRRQLETSFAREAEIVFTTLSSSGREIFERLGHGFDTVVIDEAAQASEMATLPPLRLGCNRCILVGDPQQLPATVISQEAQTMLFSRSLFERFQLAGCPALMLTLQYRMHPAIREFPSRFFYEGRLTDDESVIARPEEPYHRDHLLRPYVFFDVSKGKEKQGGRSMSLQNKLEADFAVLLYSHFRASLPPGALPRLSVGAITPYKQQSTTLKRAFDPIVADISKEGASITINTVDAYQGQERDIVILSCVRASPKGGVGFVADVRRMNVALTRARRCLWVLGNAASLSRNPDWEALIQDAKDRGCYVNAANPELLFPPQVLDQVRALQASEQAGFPGRGPPEQPGRKRHKGAHGQPQAGGDLADGSGQQRGPGDGTPEAGNQTESERSASVSGRTEGGVAGMEVDSNERVRAPTSGAELRRSLPARDPRRAVLGRSVLDPSNLGVPNPSPSVTILAANPAFDLPSPTLVFRPPSPTPGGKPNEAPTTVTAVEPGGTVRDAGAVPPAQMGAARTLLTALGVDLRQLDGVHWAEVAKALAAQTERLRAADMASAQPAAPMGVAPGLAGLHRSSSGNELAMPSRAQQHGPHFGQPNGASLQQHPTPTLRYSQPGGVAEAPFAPGFADGQATGVASSGGGAPGFPPTQGADNLAKQSSDARLGGHVAGIPPNGLSLLGLGRSGAQFGGGISRPAVLPGLREPSANGGAPTVVHALQKVQRSGQGKAGKKHKKGRKQHVDRDQGGGVGPVDLPRLQARPQASESGAQLWNAQHLMGDSLSPLDGMREPEPGPSSGEERSSGVLGANRAAVFQENQASKRQRAFDLNSVPADGEMDVDSGPPGFGAERQPD